MFFIYKDDFGLLIEEMWDMMVMWVIGSYDFVLNVVMFDEEKLVELF